MTGIDLAADVRVGTADRERAAASLGEHFSAGRLDTDEFDQRVRAAYQARTRSELAALFTDLPGPQSFRRAARNPARVDRRLMLAVLLVIASVAWVAVLHVPPFFLFVFGWLLLGRRRRFRTAGPYRRW